MNLSVGDIAPDFTLLNHQGEEVKLSEFRGKSVVLYFYPKDDTPGCTKEACSFRDNLPNFEKLGVKVFGISADSTASHKKFVGKYGLNFSLLSDVNKQVINLYEAGGISVKRISYLLDPDGKIFKAYDKVKPDEHAAEVLRDLPK